MLIIECIFFSEEAQPKKRGPKPKRLKLQVRNPYLQYVLYIYI